MLGATFCNCNYIMLYKDYLSNAIANHMPWKQISWRIHWCFFLLKSINVWKSYCQNTKGSRFY